MPGSANNSVKSESYNGPENLSKNNAMHAAYPEKSFNSNEPMSSEELYNLLEKDYRIEKHSNNVNTHRRVTNMMKRSGLSYNAAKNLVLKDKNMHEKELAREREEEEKKRPFLFWDKVNEREGNWLLEVPKGGSKGRRSRKARRTRKHKKTRKH
jgi:hypothetical protein